MALKTEPTISWDILTRDGIQETSDWTIYNSENLMTYDRLFYLKFKKRLTTCELVRMYPAQIKRVSEVALLDVPEHTLKEVLKETGTFTRLMRLKKRFSKFLEKKPL